MNTRALTFGIATFAVAAMTVSLLTVTACSNSSSTSADGSAPTPRDSGSDSTHETDSSKSKEDSGTDGDAAVATDASQTDGGDSGDAAEEALLEIPDCASESTTCNTCFTDAGAAQHPYNACSPFSSVGGGCVQFTATVPTHPTL